MITSSDSNWRASILPKLAPAYTNLGSVIRIVYSAVRTQASARHVLFLLFVFGCSGVFWTSLRESLTFSLAHDYGSHILLVLPVSVGLIWLKRHEVFLCSQSNYLFGLSLFLAAAIVELVTRAASHAQLSLQMLALVMSWISAFIVCYGTSAFRGAQFSLLFLLLLVPIPDFLIERIIFFLQSSSAMVAYWLFRAFKVPVFKEGVLFLLPTVQIEVGKECSGIRSSMALLITSIIAGEFLLRSVSRKSLLIFSTVPVLILKNGARIATLSLLAVYVDPGFLDGWLHTSGGILFYLLGLLSLIPIIVCLRRWEARSSMGTAKMRSL